MEVEQAQWVVEEPEQEVQEVHHLGRQEALVEVDRRSNTPLHKPLKKPTINPPGAGQGAPGPPGPGGPGPGPGPPGPGGLILPYDCTRATMQPVPVENWQELDFSVSMAVP
ncbi:hypothetical protein QQP08_012194 [Theobroma cacao]|nr:hypothetical protein QQP08_012194 [Theobroma cacao]